MVRLDEDKVHVHGVIERSIGAGQYDVRLTGKQVIGRTITEDIVGEELVGYQLKARVAGKMAVHSIQIVIGDEVLVEMSPYNLSEGLIVYRFRNDNRPHNPGNNKNKSNNHRS